MLLIDAGNTRIKWATLVAGSLSAHGSAERAAGVPCAIVDGASQPFYISSVAGDAFNQQLQADIERSGHGPCRFAKVRAEYLGLRLAYSNPAKLGVDRWLAMLGAMEVARGVLCVVDAGTALTIDAISADGQHLGGLIAPGTTTMMRSMLNDTARIKEADDIAKVTREGFFAADTGAAVAAGAAFAAASLIGRATRELAARLHAPVTVLLTGGEAQSLAPLIDADSETVPDLVLLGLARLAREDYP